MAKIKFGMMMTDARGKLGGQVFSKNRGGSYVRTRVIPSNPQLPSQTAVRQSFGAISQAWSGLTATQRDSWNSAVNDWQRTNIFADLITPSGKALYQRLNNQLVASGQAQVSLPPAKLEMVEGIVTSAEFTLAGTSLDLTGSYSLGNANIIVYATPMLSQGTSFVKNRLRQINTSLASAIDGVDSFENYVAKFGTPIVGANIYVGVRYVLPSGQASPMQTIKATVIN